MQFLLIVFKIQPC